MNADDADLARRSSRPAYLEGDFLLRSGKRSPLLPRQVPLPGPRPDILGRARNSGSRLPSTNARAGRRPPRRARCLGADAQLAAAASLGRRAAVRDRPRRSEVVRHREPARGCIRRRRARLPRRGTIVEASGGGAPRSRSRRSRRPGLVVRTARLRRSIARGGRSGRSRAPCRCVPGAAVPGRETCLLEAEKPRKTAWLSRQTWSW